MFLIKKILPIFSLLVLAGKALSFAFSSSPIFDVLAFLLFSIWVVWICIAFSYDKDIPTYSGNFKFEQGVNQIPRTLFAVTMSVLYLIVAVVL